MLLTYRFENNKKLYYRTGYDSCQKSCFEVTVCAIKSNVKKLELEFNFNSYLNFKLQLKAEPNQLLCLCIFRFSIIIKRA